MEVFLKKQMLKLLKLRKSSPTYYKPWEKYFKKILEKNIEGFEILGKFRKFRKSKKSYVDLRYVNVLAQSPYFFLRWEHPPYVCVPLETLSLHNNVEDMYWGLVYTQM